MNRGNGLFMNLLNGFTGTILSLLGVGAFLIMLMSAFSHPLLAVYTITMVLLGWNMLIRTGMVGEKKKKFDRFTGKHYTVREDRKVSDGDATKIFIGYLLTGTVLLLIVLAIING